MVDSILQADARRALKILKTLKQEGAEATLILWALTRELRTLATLAAQQNEGRALQQLFREQRIWPQRQPLVQQGLRRLTQQHGNGWVCSV